MSSDNNIVFVYVPIYLPTRALIDTETGDVTAKEERV